MKNFKQLNIIVGWIVFIVAAITYLLTIEPTASFWDCGEFITTSYKLEVGHPPGAPFFMILGRFFSLFAGDAANVAKMINSMSALASAFTILFLFWSITHIAQKLVKTENEYSLGQIIAILGSGAVGALAYTFSDTFWFSAVEGEVYATSSLITALVFWAILKWENVADEPGANRWIILIAYLVGLSVGVHLLNLLAIPAIVFVYYFKKYKATRKGVILSFIISILLLGMIMYVVIPGVVSIASWFELLFVNVFGLPFNTGVIFYSVLLIGGIIWGINYTMKKKMVLWNTVLVSLTVILIGYSTFAMIVIRSSANPPMDQNSPDNLFRLLSYLNREQYGDRPLTFGNYYNTPLDNNKPYVEDKKYYTPEDGKYVLTYVKQVPNFNSELCTYFPRMYSREDKHIDAYKQWANIKGTSRRITNQMGEQEVIQLPTFGENLKFFFRYQVGFMYLRYFMWNFSGRQNDIQGHGEILNGNWISGIDFLDSYRLGDQKTLPISMKENKGKNKYYLLPLLLGIIGILYMYYKGVEGKKNLWVVFLLFFMTGIAIVIYLNQYPFQPRERDYAYAGSFYAFTIWIGLGVLGLYEGLKKYLPETVSASLISVITLILVPGIMAAENWDDHDRSGRYTARDLGANYLNTCAPNGIIFTNGDNDTFPLWYNQDVEGVRTDVRVCNLSYFQTDWYVDQMKRKAYESEPLPIDYEPEQYLLGKRDIIYLMEDPRIKGAVDLRKALDFVRNEDPRTKLQHADNASYIPTKHLYLPVDKEAVIKNKVVAPEDYDKIVDTMFIDLGKKNFLSKDELMLLDILANNNWERPVYFAITVGREKYLNLQDYFQLEGFGYRVVPIKTKMNGVQIGKVNTEAMYNNMMNKFSWGNMNDPDVYIDENNSRMMMNIRNNFNRLATALIEEGKKDSAVNVLDRCIELIPNEIVPYNYFAIMMGESYLKAGHKEKAKEIFNTIMNNYKDEIEYYFAMDSRFYKTADDEIQRVLYFMREINMVCMQNHFDEMVDEVSATFSKYLDRYNSMNR